MLPPFYVMELMRAADEAEQRGRDVLHMEVGEPAWPPPTVVRESLADAVRSGPWGYTSALGDRELRAAIAEQYPGATDAQVLVSTGTSPVLLLALACVVRAGDEVIVFDPGYPCVPNFVRLLGAQPRVVTLRPEDGFRPSLDAVRAARSARTRALVVGSPANPTGVTLTSEELAALAETMPCLIVDEIYRGIEYADAPVASAWALDAGNVIVVDGFSKKYAMTGFRLGYGVFPPALIRAAENIHQSMVISASPFVQKAGLTALTHPDIPSIRRDWMSQLAEARGVLLDGLAQAGIPVPSPPEGAFYALADVGAFTNDSLAFALELLDATGVAATPGVDFGPSGSRYLRFSFARGADVAREATARIADWLSAR